MKHFFKKQVILMAIMGIVLPFFIEPAVVIADGALTPESNLVADSQGLISQPNQSELVPTTGDALAQQGLEPIEPTAPVTEANVVETQEQTTPANQITNAGSDEDDLEDTNLPAIEVAPLQATRAESTDDMRAPKDISDIAVTSVVLKPENVQDGGKFEINVAFNDALLAQENNRIVPGDTIKVNWNHSTNGSIKPIMGTMDILIKGSVGAKLTISETGAVLTFTDVVATWEPNTIKGGFNIGATGSNTSKEASTEEVTISSGKESAIVAITTSGRGESNGTNTDLSFKNGKQNTLDAVDWMVDINYTMSALTNDLTFTDVISEAPEKQVFDESTLTITLGRKTYTSFKAFNDATGANLNFNGTDTISGSVPKLAASENRLTMKYKTKVIYKLDSSFKLDNELKVTTAIDDKPVSNSNNVSADFSWAGGWVSGEGSANIELVKVEKGTDQGLGGAEFLISKDKSDFFDSSKKVSDSEGKIKFSGLKENTTYYIKEVKAPTGYTLNPEIQSITTGVSNTSKEIKVENEKETPKTTSITATKIWADLNNIHQKRPQEITFNLLANEREIDRKTFSGQGNTWTVEFKDLPILDENGKEINYRINEDLVPNYTATVEGNTVTNTYVPETTNLTATKKWEDNNNRDGKRPNTVTINVKDGQTVVDTLTVLAPQWKATSKALPKYDNNAQPIMYTLEEVNVPTGYTSSVDGMTVTNTYTPETTTVKAVKKWEDKNDQDGKRPNEVTINVKDGSEVVDTLTVLAPQWEATSKELPKNKNGQAITYTLEEVNVPTGYTSSVDGMTVTNTYTPETTTVKAVKKWEDKNDQDGKRPNEVTINVKDGSEVVDTLTVTGPSWEATSKKLPKNKNGKAITYTLEEVAVPTGYTSSVDGMTVTNTYTPETTTVKAVKKWEDKNDQDGKRPNEVTINVKDGSEVVDTLTVTGPSWEATSKKLPKNKNGKAITYTLEEVAVPTGYTSSVDGMTVTNTYVPETTSLTVTKKWEDQQEKFPTRPTTIQAELIATVSKEEIKTEKITLSEANRWSHEFSNLPVYYNKEKISYSVKEINVPAGYESKVTGTTITNTLKTKEIPVTKVWDDHMNQDGTRPKEVIFHLLADGKAIDSITLTGSDDVEKWTGTFKNVPMKNQAGEDISYTIAEEAVAGYTIATGGIDNQSFTITNVDAPDKTSVTVTKVWDDAANQDGKRPENITVTLVKGNQPTDKQVVLSEANKWTHTWTDLDLHTKPGKPIKYSVREEQVAHYDAPVVNRLDASNIQLVNTHKPEEVTIKGAKTWQDEDNQHGIRPEFIIVTMQKNGIDYLSMKVTDKTNWAYDFGAQPKYEKGKEITYTVTEEDVTGYNAQVDGFNITNTLILGSVALVKTDAAGKPLANATFKLTKDGKQVGDHQTTDKSGRIQFDQLIIGTYQLEEVSAPTGYIRNTSPLTVNVTKDKLTQELSMMNYQGSAWVMKTDAANRPLKGAEFAVVSVANNTVKEITDKRLVTDRAGVASIEGLAPGKYAFVETKAPNGYQLNPEYKYFTIEAEQAGQVASVYAGDVINHLKPTTPSTTDTTSTSESTNSTTTDTTSTSESTSSTTTDTTSTSESTSSTTTDTTSTSESTSSTTTDTTSTSESTSSTTTDTESITVSPETTDSTSSTTTDTTSTSESTSSTTTDTESLIVTPGSTDKAPSSSSQSLTSSSMKDTNDKPKGKQLPKTGEQASSVLVIGLGILLVAIAYVVYRKRHVN